jgi:hypothetical protein
LARKYHQPYTNSLYESKPLPHGILPRTYSLLSEVR